MRKYWTLRLVIVFSLALSLAVPAAWGLSDAEIAEQIQFSLDQRHPKDTPEWWRALGPTAPSVIISMYEKSNSVFHRLRLVQGLGYFDDPKATDFLKSLALNSDKQVLQNAAIRSIGLSQGPKETEFVSRFLGNPDPNTRYAAANALQGIYDRTKDGRTKDLLDGYRKEEKVPWVLDKLKGELPKPNTALAPVASSEDQNLKSLEGSWKGYLVSPDSDPAKGMKSEAAVLRFKGDSPESFKGDLILKLKGKYRIVTLGKIVWKAPRSSHFTASWSEGKQSQAVEGELSQQAGAQLLSIRVAQVGATLIVRKEPTSR